MRIFITGGTGSLGRALINRWYDRYEITVFSRDEVKQGELRSLYPDVHFVLGDVRDLSWLTLATRGHDLIVHAAAYKQVPSSEVNAGEAISTNVNGSFNVARAAVANDIATVIGVSTDKACLDYHSRVVLADGSTKAISSLVREKSDVLVKTFDGPYVGGRPITGWYKNKLQGRQMYRISYEGNYQHRGYTTGVCVTNDHLIMTPVGWKRADRIFDGDLICTAEKCPNPRQKALLVGSILGDSNISKRGRGYIRFGHAESQLEWLLIKYSALEDLAASPPAKACPIGKEPFWTFNTKSAAYVEDLREQFVSGTGKTISYDLFSDCFSPELMAAWYLDDGCLSDGLARISMGDFSYKDCSWVADFLTTRGFVCKPYKATVQGTQYSELRFTRSGSDMLFEVIGRFVPPTLAYKLPKWAPAYDPESWNLGTASHYFGRAIVEQVDMGNRDVYCIDVEDTHNFIVGNVIVHNCAPINCYGQTKALMEKLFQQACLWGEKTSFRLVRYGNVLGSRGSVVPLFLRQAQTGTITITDPNMTRYWLTLNDAVDLIEEATQLPYKGAILVPQAKASTMRTLAQAVAPEANIEYIGVRAGEKMHEQLVHSNESLNALCTTNNRYIILPAYEQTHTLYDNDAPTGRFEFSSDIAEQLSATELREMLCLK